MRYVLIDNAIDNSLSLRSSTIISFDYDCRDEWFDIESVGETVRRKEREWLEKWWPFESDRHLCERLRRLLLEATSAVAMRRQMKSVCLARALLAWTQFTDRWIDNSFQWSQGNKSRSQFIHKCYVVRVIEKQRCPAFYRAIIPRKRSFNYRFIVLKPHAFFT